MESKIRGNVLSELPNGKQFCFPSVSQGMRPTSHWKTSFGARAFRGFQDCFFRDRPMDTARVAVVGAGLMGLSTAVCVSRLAPRCSVTVIADKFTPDTTSDVAAGMLIPHAYPDTPIHKQKQWFRETFDHLLSIASSAEAGDAGVLLVSGWQIFQSLPTEEVPFWADVVLGFRKMTEEELKKFPQHVFGQAFTTLKCEGSAYLPWLEKRVKGSGGQILTRRVEDLWELHPSFDIVVNCTGLGSRQLAGDSKIFPNIFYFFLNTENNRCPSQIPAFKCLTLVAEFVPAVPVTQRNKAAWRPWYCPHSAASAKVMHKLLGFFLTFRIFA
ncbi:D-aspartate oxidase isoform X3 [Eulemur rufifrons]|uniref:D-aspartate oxidase isoform X3 n=1 Tax=Eulemur rufifrons TaxID=859984 RepID=UPI0037444AF6